MSSPLTDGDPAIVDNKVVIAALQARVLELVDFLEDAQWEWDGCISDCCKYCRGNSKDGHESDCELSAELSRKNDTAALEGLLKEALAEAGRYAAKIAERFEERWHISNTDEYTYNDTASNAILNDLCDPDDPDVLRIVARLVRRVGS